MQVDSLLWDMDLEFFRFAMQLIVIQEATYKRGVTDNLGTFLASETTNSITELMTRINPLSA